MQVSKDLKELLLKAIRKHGSIDLPAHGYSMFPLIRDGEICRFVYCDSSELNVGDIVLFHSWSGQLVAHRFCRYEEKPALEQPRLVFKGDTNFGHDEPVPGERLIGKLTWIQKHKGPLHVNRSVLRLWGLFLVKFPFVSLLLKMTLLRKS